jgi:hypothetical protein
VSSGIGPGAGALLFVVRLAAKAANISDALMLCSSSQESPRTYVLSLTTRTIEARLDAVNPEWLQMVEGPCSFFLSLAVVLSAKDNGTPFE